MQEQLLKKNRWYWIRREDGSLAPYRFYQVGAEGDRQVGEFFVGSFIRKFSLNRVVGEPRMPEDKSDT